MSRLISLLYIDQKIYLLKKIINSPNSHHNNRRIFIQKIDMMDTSKQFKEDLSTKLLVSSLLSNLSLHQSAHKADCITLIQIAISPNQGPIEPINITIQVYDIACFRPSFCYNDQGVMKNNVRFFERL